MNVTGLLVPISHLILMLRINHSIRKFSRKSRLKNTDLSYSIIARTRAYSRTAPTMKTMQRSRYSSSLVVNFLFGWALNRLMTTKSVIRSIDILPGTTLIRDTFNTLLYINFISRPMTYIYYNKVLLTEGSMMKLIQDITTKSIQGIKTYHNWTSKYKIMVYSRP